MTFDGMGIEPSEVDGIINKAKAGKLRFASGRWSRQDELHDY